MRSLTDYTADEQAELGDTVEVIKEAFLSGLPSIYGHPRLAGRDKDEALGLIAAAALQLAVDFIPESVPLEERRVLVDVFREKLLGVFDVPKPAGGQRR